MISKLKVGNFLKNYNFVKSNTELRLFSVNNSDIKKRICIIGSGPAGFYAAQYLLKHLDNSYVDVIEKLPVPFGLVRYGVAPDHAEVKNVIHTFSKTAENERFRFFGNLALGRDFTLNELKEKYHAVLLTYGADRDRTFGIPNENLQNVISAREFVAWYNGLPGSGNLNPDLSGRTVTLLGQGNVAVDVSRILLSSVDNLRKTDITEYALECLSRSKIEKVHLVGRRGPLQAAFTIKELREMIRLPNCTTKWRKADFIGVDDVLPNLPRPKKRIMDLMLKSLSEMDNAEYKRKTFEVIFFRSPVQFIKNGDEVEAIEYTTNKLIENKAISTGVSEFLRTDLICRSIGYKSVNIDSELNFNDCSGFVNNVAGRVMKKTLTGSDHTIDDIEDKFETGLYVSGWLATGPTGVILTTMNNAFAVGNVICKDFQDNVISVKESKPGINVNGQSIVTWEGWKKIDKFEMDSGKKIGKSREKLISIPKMLEIANS